MLWGGHFSLHSGFWVSGHEKLMTQQGLQEPQEQRSRETFTPRTSPPSSSVTPPTPEFSTSQATISEALYFSLANAQLNPEQKPGLSPAAMINQKPNIHAFRWSALRAPPFVPAVTTCEICVVHHYPVPFAPPPLCWLVLLALVLLG